MIRSCRAAFPDDAAQSSGVASTSTVWPSYFDRRFVGDGAYGRRQAAHHDEFPVDQHPSESPSAAIPVGGCRARAYHRNQCAQFEDRRVAPDPEPLRCVLALHLVERTEQVFNRHRPSPPPRIRSGHQRINRPAGPGHPTSMESTARLIACFGRPWVPLSRVKSEAE